MKNNNTQETIKLDILASSDNDKLVPKFCNRMQVALASESTVAIRMLFTEDGKSHVLIEKIVIDIEQTRQLYKILGGFLSSYDNAVEK